MRKNQNVIFLFKINGKFETNSIAEGALKL